MKGLYVDVETTGRDEKRCGLHEVACILTVNSQPVERREWLIRPFEGAWFETGWDVRPDLTEDKVMGYPTSEEQFNIEFAQMLEMHINRYDPEDKAFFLGYNAQFDARFVRELFLRCGNDFFGTWFFSPVLDVMPIALYSLRHERYKLENFKLETVYKRLTGKDLDAHTGIEDIEATRELFRTLYPSDF